MDLCSKQRKWIYVVNFSHFGFLIFSLQYRNVNPLRMRQSLGSNSPLVTRGSYQFPTYGLAVVVKKKIPTTRGFASRGRNLFFTTPAKPWRGELVWTSRDLWGITFPFTHGRPLVKGNLPCLRLILNGLGHTYIFSYTYF